MRAKRTSLSGHNEYEQEKKTGRMKRQMGWDEGDEHLWRERERGAGGGGRAGIIVRVWNDFTDFGLERSQWKSYLIRQRPNTTEKEKKKE